MAEYSAYTDIKIGVSVVALTSVTELQYSGEDALVPPPRTSFREAVEMPEIANGHVKLLGKPVIVWSFENITNLARKALRQFITSGMSEDIYIASPDENGDMQNWACVMRWPEREPSYLAFRMIDSLEITFTNCVQQ